MQQHHQVQSQIWKSRPLRALPHLSTAIQSPWFSLFSLTKDRDFYEGTKKKKKKNQLNKSLIDPLCLIIIFFWTPNLTELSIHSFCWEAEMVTVITLF